MSREPSSPAAQLADKGVRRIAITWVNHAGATLVKVVPLKALEQAFEVGVGFSPVSDAFRADGAIDPAHGLAVPDGDLRLRADRATLSPLEPANGWAWTAGERCDRLGVPYAGDQRHFCRSQSERLGRAGLELEAGFELEWFLATAEPDGTPRPAIAGGPYGADRLVEGLDYATALLDALDSAELPWLQFHPEYGASQFELSLGAGTALEAADRLVRAKLVIQRVSQTFGWRCSFSPKPSLERVGNGGHLHLSVSYQGCPLFQGGEREAGLTAEGASILASLLKQLPSLMALSSPLTVSYLRLIPSTWSAPFQIWGVENREAALRLIPAAGDGVRAHLELKVADLAANPYLLLGAVQALVLHGFEHQTPLPPPISGDPAADATAQARRLPGTLSEARDAFGASAVMRQAMGTALHGSLLDSLASELRRNEGLSPEAQVAANCWWPLVGGMV